MKNKTTYAFLCMIFIFSLRLTSVAQTDAEMKAWQAYMTPGDMHKMLSDADGEWNTDVKMWMAPNGQPVTSKGTCTNKMLLGGRYQESHFKGSFMDQPMEGIGHMAYDNAKKQFESTWMDNMGSGIMKSSGTYDPATKTLSMSGMQTDPMTGKDMPFRETVQFMDNNNHVMSMYMTSPDGQEFKGMEIKFSRKK
jgi:hypothetical protein